MDFLYKKKVLFASIFLLFANGLTNVKEWTVFCLYYYINDVRLIEVFPSKTLDFIQLQRRYKRWRTFHRNKSKREKESTKPEKKINEI